MLEIAKQETSKPDLVSGRKTVYPTVTSKLGAARLLLAVILD